MNSESKNKVNRREFLRHGGAAVAGAAGLAALEQLTDRYVDQLPLSREECLEYISELLTYELGPKELEGMELFRTMIAELDAPEDLSK